MKQVDFYQSHLDRVSRSFAFCIARLEGDLRNWVSLSYLLCRVLDTIEDASWPSGSKDSDQSMAFDQFKNFLENEPTPESVKFWGELFPESIPEGEALLLKEAHQLFLNLHALPNSVMLKIKRSVLNMYRGMRFFQNEGASLRLNSMAEVNRYCFFVAGLVGELLTDLLCELRPALGSQKLYLDSHHFGLFLQKVNLLKDQSKDEREGRFLIHSRKEVLASLARDAEGAIRYLQALPIADRGYRLFCAWSLFLGLASLPWIEKSRALQFLKIPRFITERLLASVEGIIDDNHELLALFKKMLPQLPLSMEPGPKLFWSGMAELYEGKLSQEQFAELGLY